MSWTYEKYCSLQPHPLDVGLVVVPERDAPVAPEEVVHELPLVPVQPLLAVGHPGEKFKFNIILPYLVFHWDLQYLPAVVEAAAVEGVSVPLLVLVRTDQVVPLHVLPERGTKKKNLI